MNELEKRLNKLKKDGYEFVDINQILNWICEIKRDNRLKRYERTRKIKRGLS